MEFFLAFVGFGSLILIVYLLLTEKTNPAVAFIIVSGCSAIGLALLDINLQLGIGGLLKDKFEIAYFAKIENPVFDFKALSFFIKQGISSVSSTAVLFIFAILFFGLLNEAGVFNKIINHLLKFSKKMCMVSAF